MTHELNTKITIKYSPLVDDKDIYQTRMWSQVQNFEHSEGLAAEV